MRHVRDGFLVGLGGALWLVPDFLAVMPEGPRLALTVGCAAYAMTAIGLYAGVRWGRL